MLIAVIGDGFHSCQCWGHLLSGRNRAGTPVRLNDHSSVRVTGEALGAELDVAQRVRDVDTNCKLRVAAVRSGFPVVLIAEVRVAPGGGKAVFVRDADP